MSGDGRGKDCKCGYPDMPGFCPGPRNCPMAQPDEEFDDEPECTAHEYPGDHECLPNCKP